MSFQVGDMVIPISKTKGVPWRESGQIENMKAMGQPFLYVVRIRDGYYSCSAKQYGGGDHFSKRDLIPYTEGEEQLFTLMVQGTITEKQYESYRERGQG